MDFLATIYKENGEFIEFEGHVCRIYAIQKDETTKVEECPLYEAIRAWAQVADYPVVDIYAGMKAETERGNWDLRVRGLPAPEHAVVDDAFDTFFGGDPAFFTNIHPNSRCLGLIAEWELEQIRRYFGTTLLVGG